MNDAERTRFDALVEQEVQRLPYAIQILLEETPLLVEDRPSSLILEELGLDESQSEEICGLHSGIGLTERSVEDSAEAPETVTIYREGIMALARDRAAGSSVDVEEELAREIRVTILHEIGHHFGLDEEDLEKLGFA
jgi:predicted Zn-dependent protease with MMP-like domain